MGSLKGAIVEYGSDFLGPLPNVIVFQFNPEQLVRTINIAQGQSGGSDSGDRARPCERGQRASSPTESFTLKAHFSAAEDLNGDKPLSVVARAVGIGPQLAALEMLVAPTNIIGGAIGAAVDAIGGALGLGGEEAAETPTPREKAPRVLFIWGLGRFLPIDITSMKITEQKFDFLLNPVQAQVELGMTVANCSRLKDDSFGKGALMVTQTIKEAQAAINLAKSIELTVEMVGDIVPF